MDLSVGVESADSAVLKILRKGTSVADSHKSVDGALLAGIPSVRALFMMGTPGETPKTLRLNKAWAEQHPEVTICLTAFCPLPGTAIWDDPARFGIRPELGEDHNFYVWRGNGTDAEAHISIVDGLTRDDLTAQLRAFRDWLEERKQINHG